jgi:SAM-dependent methyltransferase
VSDGDVTGERLIPQAQRGELVYAEHLSRYRFATRFAAGRRVLDIACGEGYGTSMLAKSGAAEVVGADIDEITVRKAQERYGLEFLEADIGSLPFEDDRFDLIVCFETIEHVADADKAIAEMRRVLTPAGILVISTPNARRYLVDNPFHTREFNSDEFLDLLRPHFPAGVRGHGQFNVVTSLIASESPDSPDPGAMLQPWPVSEFLVAEVPVSGDELYMVAVCGPSEDSPGGVAVGATLDESHALAARAAEAERQVLDWYGQAMDAVKEVDAANERAVAAVALRDEAMARAQEAERRLQEVRESLSWRLTAPLRAAAERVRALRAGRR